MQVLRLIMGQHGLPPNDETLHFRRKTLCETTLHLANFV